MTNLPTAGSLCDTMASLESLPRCNVLESSSLTLEICSSRIWLFHKKTGQVPGKKVKGGLRKNGVHLQMQRALMNESLNEV